MNRYSFQLPLAALTWVREEVQDVLSTAPVPVIEWGTSNGLLIYGIEGRIVLDQGSPSEYFPDIASITIEEYLGGVPASGAGAINYTNMTQLNRNRAYMQQGYCRFVEPLKISNAVGVVGLCAYLRGNTNAARATASGIVDLVLVGEFV